MGMANPDEALTHETIELLQAMIRNRCVNDGSPDSGQEVRNVELLQDFLGGAAADSQSYEPERGRTSLVARIEGSDPSAPSICLMGHTDVVPATAEGWRQDPFGGDLVDGEVWGRGALDMLNVTSSMAVVFRHLRRMDFKPRGTLIFLAVADEEAGGTHGARWLVDHAYDVVGADYVLTEFGGLPRSSGPYSTVSIHTAEKGLAWRRLRVKGRPGHGSMPCGADNAIIKGAEVVRRLADYRPRANLTGEWRALIGSLALDDATRDALLDPERVTKTIEGMPPAVAGFLHACTHTTFSPNISRGGTKINVIPDEVVIELDVRTMPGETSADVAAHLRQALGDLADQVEVEAVLDSPSSRSPTDTPMWHTLCELANEAYPEARVIPALMVGCTDARFYRQKGAIAYGAGLFSRKVELGDFASRFHGLDERIDVESLALTTQLWLELAKRMLSA